MFERFTEKAIKVIMLAQEEARRLGHNFVGTEQILLGLIGEGTGIGPKVLKSMGVNLKDARVEVEKITSDNAELISKILARRGCNKVLWECGPSLATAAIQSNCIQEIITFIAPKILGGHNSMNPFGDFEFEEMHEVIKLSDTQVSFISNDICVKSLFKN